LEKESKTSRYETRNRLYEQGKKKDAVRECLSKMREEHLENEQLSECTFQPNMIKPYLKHEGSQEKTPRVTKGGGNDVFSRLYR
jgi:hypothetical protein